MYGVRVYPTTQHERCYEANNYQVIVVRIGGYVRDVGRHNTCSRGYRSPADGTKTDAILVTGWIGWVWHAVSVPPPPLYTFSCVHASRRLVLVIWK